MKTVEIYFRNLDEETQQELLNAYGIKDPSEANWDSFPVTTVEVYEDGE